MSTSLRKSILTAGLALSPLFFANSGAAQVLLSENFDSMGPTGTTLPAKWIAGFLGPAGTNRVAMSPYGANGFSLTAMPIVVNDGTAIPSPNVGTVMNLGVAGAVDRALGNYPRTNPSGDQVMQVEVANTTGGFLSGIQLSYDGEQWRQSQGTAPAPEKLRVLISTTSATDGFIYLGEAFDFVAPKGGPANLGLDGNLAENRASISLSYTFLTPVPAGGNFYVRWHDWNDDATTDHFLAIDNVMITVVPEPGILSLALLGLGLWAGRAKRLL